MQPDASPDTVWINRYGYVCPPEQGKIITIAGVNDRDYYNPTICDVNDQHLLAFRLETRDSSVYQPVHYHPAVAFAAPTAPPLSWQLTDQPAAFDMLEDPTFTKVVIDGQPRVVFGGVRVTFRDHAFAIQTELYMGSSMYDLPREPFAIIHDMKDVRLLQLPDRRFLLCRRPKGATYGEGRITLHILDSLEQITRIDTIHPPTLAVLDSGYEHDWVGTNSVYLLQDEQRDQWVGLLGHLAQRDINNGQHYAATTYKIRLDELLEGAAQSIMPNVIATRGCFEPGPEKTHGLKDVVFPGSLEPLGGERYRLWAGLSDARIGTVVVDDPFHIRQAAAAGTVNAPA